MRVRLGGTPSASKGLGRSFRPDIEGLRAVAVLLVVLYHAKLRFSGGFVGVDVFFVISGYLITGLLVRELAASGSISLRRFYGRRARRLLPLSAVVVIVTSLACAWLLNPLNLKQALVDALSAVGFSANWHFAADAIDYMAQTDSSPFLHFWSLAVEEQFYAVWPLLLLLIFRASKLAPRLRWERAAIVTLSGLSLLSLACSVLTSASSGPWAYFGLQTRAWELGVGGLVAIVPVPAWLRRRVSAQVLALAGAAAIAAAGFGFDDHTIFPGAAALLPVCGAAAVIAAGRAVSADKTIVGRGLALPPARFVGRMSYAWYLWHWPVLTLLPRALTAVGWGDRLSGRSVSVAALVLSFGLSVATHYTIEAPLRNAAWLRQRARRSLGLGVGLTGLSTAVAVLCLFSATAEATIVVPAAQAASPTLSTHPVVLKQTPAQARDDRPDESSGCYVGSYQSARVPADCVFGPANAPLQVALIGDSHAEQWFPAFKAAADAGQLRLYYWTKAACPVVHVTTYLPSLKGPYTACAQWRQTVAARLMTIPHLDAIVFTSASFYGPEMIDGAGHRLSRADASEAWQRGARDLFTALPAVPLVRLRDTPKPTVDVPACLAEHSKQPSKCEVPLSHAHPDAGLWRAEQAAAAAAGRPLLELDPTMLFCGSGSCGAVAPRLGLVVYRDDSHITASFARAQAGWAAAGLRQLLDHRH